MKSELSASAKDVFFFPGGRGDITFLRGKDGKVSSAHFVPPFGPESDGKKTDEPLPADRSEVKVDPALFDAFAGVYNLFPGFDLAITREGDKLFAQATGQGKLELHPASENKYFPREVELEIEFVRGADGKVESLILNQAGKWSPARGSRKAAARSRAPIRSSCRRFPPALGFPGRRVSHDSLSAGR